MNLLFRILLAVYGFCLTIVSFIAASISFKPEIFSSIVEFMELNVLPSDRARIMLFVISTIFLILSLTFLLSGIKSSKDKKTISRGTNIGEIKISLHSIESIALVATRRLSGIKDSKVTVSKFGDGITINIKVVILGDVNIPTLTEDIQVKVKTSVEESTGIKVNDVSVVVENVHSGLKTRVE